MYISINYVVWDNRVTFQCEAISTGFEDVTNEYIESEEEFVESEEEESSESDDDVVMRKRKKKKSGSTPKRVSSLIQMSCEILSFLARNQLFILLFLQII